MHTVLWIWRSEMKTFGRFFRKRLFLIPATESGEDGIYMKQIISFCGEASKRTQDGLLQ